jgi:hypothetical protein
VAIGEPLKRREHAQQSEGKSESKGSYTGRDAAGRKTSYLARLRKAQGGDGKFVKVTNLGPVTQMFTSSSATPEKPKPDQNAGDAKPVEAPAQSSSSATP